jgi:hypothetical protein
MPALPLGDAGPYVAAAFLVFLALVLIYVAIMAAKLTRLEREIVELAELAERRDAARGGTAGRDPAAAGSGQTAEVGAGGAGVSP